MLLAEPTHCCWVENSLAEDSPCCGCQEASDGPLRAILGWVRAQRTVPWGLPTPGWTTARRSSSTIISELFLFSLFYWRVCFYCPIRPRLASSLVLLYLCWPPSRCPGWSGVGCSHLQAVREGSNLERERGFLCNLAGAQAMCPTPASPGLSSLGHQAEIPISLVHTHTSPRAAPLQLEH